VAGPYGDGNEPYVSIIGTLSLYSAITVKRRLKESHDQLVG
jgi:hypothetical protein